MVLLALTTGASFLSLGPWNAVIALAIGAAKATLIVAVFMEVAYRRGMTRVLVGTGLFWLGVMVVLTFSDYLTRGWIPSVGK